MKNRILLSGLLVLTVLIALSVASATVYLSKSGSQLSEDALVSGGTSNNYVYKTSYGGSILTLAQRYSSYWYYGFALPQTLDQNDDFFARFKWIRTDNWLCSSGTCFSKYGLWSNAGALLSSTVDVSVATDGKMYSYFVNDTGTASSSGSSFVPSASTYYISTLTHDSASNSVTARIYNTAGTLLASSVLDLGDQTFSLDRIGVFPLRSGSANDNYWYLTEIHVNSGVNQEGFPIKILSETGYSFNTSTGTNVTATGQSGIQNVYAYNTSTGIPSGMFTINFDSFISDINLPTIASETNITAGKAFFHNTSGAYPEGVTPYLLVPKTIGGPYHCPDATSLNDVNDTCNNIDTNPSVEEVTIDGQVYYKMSNQGGGNGGGSSVPEFSDLGWIFAAVLGAGGFFVLRKRYI